MTVETDIISQTYASQQTFSADRLVDGYLWMDWFSIPQVGFAEPLSTIELTVLSTLNSNHFINLTKLYLMNLIQFHTVL